MISVLINDIYKVHKATTSREKPDIAERAKRKTSSESRNTRKADEVYLVWLRIEPSSREQRL